jgi:hypothetical protein
VTLSRGTGRGTLNVNWNALAPANTGGVPLASYTVTVFVPTIFGNLFVQSKTVSASTTTAGFTGAVSGLNYVAQVSATNTSGITGAPSGNSAGVRPAVMRGLVLAGVLPNANRTVIAFTPRVATAPATRWTVRVYSTTRSTQVLASCTATAQAGTCSTVRLQRGRTYYVSIVKVGSTTAAVKAALRTKVRVS